MLIFDSFPCRQEAELFAANVERQFNLSANVYDSQEESAKIDPIPRPLVPPIVLVDRPDLDNRTSNAESTIIKLAKQFAGRLVGT